MVAIAERRSFSVAAIPGSFWSYGVRVWLATVLALFVSFWLQLEIPSTAAVTVAILAEPTRGQTLEKAGFRLMATVVGVIASIAITGVFSQARDLILAAAAVWLGLCVFAAMLFDGYRAYAGVLSGYTVAIVAIEQIDHPQHVFDVGMERGAAIAVGILAIAVVNTLTLAPERHSRLAEQLGAIHRRVREYARTAFLRDGGNSATFLALLQEILSPRPDMGSVSLESGGGSIKSAAARSTAVGLMAELQAARILHSGMPVGAVDGQDRAFGATTALSRKLLRKDEDVRHDLLALTSARWPSRLWRAPLYRSYRIAAESGVRAALWFAITSIFFVWAGWSSTSVSLALAATIAALGATTPNPRGFTAIALVGAPIAAALAGILEFILLDGTDSFLVLALALAPFTIVAALLTKSQSPLWSGLGRINLIAIPTILAPSNPQSYNPQSFLVTSLLVIAAAAVLLVAQMLVSPLSDDRQRAQLLAEARRDLEALGRSDSDTSDDATFRDASRIGQFLSAGGDRATRGLAEMLSCFDRSAMARLCGPNSETAR